MITRRGLLLSCAAIPASIVLDSLAVSSDASNAIGALEERVGGRVGVFAMDVPTGRTVEHRPDERFAMCSTFKWLLAAQLLSAVDRNVVRLGDQVPLERADLIENSPISRKHLKRGAMTLRELGEAAVTVSDNTAANLLLHRLGGPAALTEFARSLGDSSTRLDRMEPELNTNEKGDVRDTTTPRGMVRCMRAALVDDALSPTSKRQLLTWLRACETGLDRLRAGLPQSWNAGDKTGTGLNHAVNDIAIGFPPGRGHVLIAAYMSEGLQPVPELNAVQAQVAKLVSSLFSYPAG